MSLKYVEYVTITSKKKVDRLNKIIIRTGGLKISFEVSCRYLKGKKKRTGHR